MGTPASFKPGQSGNLNGRPKKGWTMKGLIEDALDEEDESGVPHKLIIARKLITVAETGDIAAIKEVNNRIDGLPEQKVEAKIDGTYNIDINGLIGLSASTTQATTSDSAITGSED